MKDEDQKLLWESYMESKRPDYPDVDDDGDKKESMEKALKDKEEDDVAEEAMEPKEDELSDFEKKRLKLHAKEKTDAQKKGEASQNEIMKQDLKTESNHEVGLDSIHDAMRNLTGPERDDGDWEFAIKQIMQGVAERVIYHAKIGDGGVLGDPDLARRWDLKTGIEDAVSDLLDSATSDQLGDAFRKAFHNARKDEQEGRWDFANQLADSPAPVSHPRDRDPGV